MSATTIRLVLAVEAALFALASGVHAGALLDGFAHGMASTAEGVIAAVLGTGLLVTLLRPDWVRVAALLVQGFALLGTGVGIFAMVRGFGPQSDLDLAIHAVFVALLVSGLWGAWRLRGHASNT